MFRWVFCPAIIVGLLLGGQTVKMPLVFAVACSNEIPEDSTRRAIYDRLLIREEVKDIEMAENFRAVLDRNENPPPKVPMHEIAELWTSADGVKVSNDVKDALTELREKIHDQGVKSSNRRWFESVRVLRASAALDGRPVTDPQDLESLSSHRLGDHRHSEAVLRQSLLPIGIAKRQRGRSDPFRDLKSPDPSVFRQNKCSLKE